MEASESTLTFQARARYYVMGDIANTTELWFVLHGYGQLAQYFIRKFHVLSDLGITVIAPEGLSKFYLQGNRGRVGATWMTTENRLMEIENYIAYLNEVFAEQTNNRCVKKTLLGFSQGAATATRWMLNGSASFDSLILWAGLFPTDIDFTKGSQLLNKMRVFEVFGTDDEFINAERIDEMHRLNALLNISPTVIEFDGKHDIHAPTLTKLVSLQ